MDGRFEPVNQCCLVAYFSWAENAVQDDIDAMNSASVKALGNVAQLAAGVAEETGGELFSIRVSEPYLADWDGCLDRANEEKANGIHPELVQTIANISDYDVVFLGYPNWWYSCPMAIHSFLDTHDLSGKQVYLFCSHGTGGLANSVNDIEADISDAELSEDVFHAYQDDTASVKEELMTWLDDLGWNVSFSDSVELNCDHSQKFSLVKRNHLLAEGVDEVQLLGEFESVLNSLIRM